MCLVFFTLLDNGSIAILEHVLSMRLRCFCCQ